MKQFFALIFTLAVCATGFAAEPPATSTKAKTEDIVSIDGVKYYVHTIAMGETLSALAKQYNISEQAIAASNPTVKAETLQVGKNIRIPLTEPAKNTAKPAAKSDAKPADNPQTSPRATAAAPQTKAEAKAAAKAERKLQKTYEFHTVAQGETFYAIAKRYQIPVATLTEDNPAINPAQLRIGERVLVRKKQIGKADESEFQKPMQDSVATRSETTYTVQKGDTFYSLSHRFHITEEQLSALNDGLQPQDLKAGAVLKIPGAPTQTTAAADSPAIPALLPDSTREVNFTAMSPAQTLDIALLLPMTTAGKNDPNFLDFYQGFLLGLDSVKRAGYSAHVDLFDTQRSPNRVREIVADRAFQNANLIVGPVYEDELTPVIDYAEQQSVPIVTPLADMTRTESDALFQLAPDSTTKWDKAADLIDGSRKITLIYSANIDKDFEQEALAMLGSTPHSRYDYSFERKAGGSTGGDLSNLVENKQANLFIVLASDPVTIDRILVALASAQSNLTSRGRSGADFVVLGNTRWNRYPNIDHTNFFADRVVFVSSYHAKRDAQVITAFDSAYIRAFSALPSLYSYRGYDAALVFAPAMFGEIANKLEGGRYVPLQTAYRFVQEQPEGNHTNAEWMRVEYNPDFTITVK